MAIKGKARNQHSDKPPRPIRIIEDVAYVPLTRGYEAVIDAADVALVEGKNWHVIVFKRTAYASTCVKDDQKRKAILLHRLILDAPQDMQVDHINGDGLDNKRCNLRIATRFENQRNRRVCSRNKSGFKGVHFSKAHKKWRASITFNGGSKQLGCFETPEEAHDAYIRAAKRMYGEFARFA